ncbi:MAG: RAD55 family ATPase [Candidatus Kariarchaeaceae archaeon]|jgi:KaiC/GvpD/RAD55 family RecA-like ATPase
METTRVSSGSIKIDEHIQSGFPLGSVIAYLSRPGIGKTTSGLIFIDNGIKHGENSLIITTRSTIPHLRSLSRQTKLNIDEAIFVDAANWRIKRINPKIKRESQYEVTNLTDLNALLATIVQACKDKSNIKRILFDTPTSLLLYSTPGKEQFLKFFELLTAFTRSNDITLIYTLELGVHPSSIVSTLLFLSDGAVYYRFNPRDHWKREFKIAFLALTEVLPTWIEYQ